MRHDMRHEPRSDMSDGSPVRVTRNDSGGLFATCTLERACSISREQLLPINNNQYKRMPTMRYWPLIFLSSLVININHISASLLRRQLQEETTSKPLPNVDYELTLHPGHGGCSGVQKPTLDSK